MAANLKASSEQFHRMINALIAKEQTIVDAHVNLGIPMEDLIAAAARRCANTSILDNDAQLPLPLVANPGRGGR